MCSWQRFSSTLWVSSSLDCFLGCTEVFISTCQHWTQFPSKWSLVQKVLSYTYIFQHTPYASQEFRCFGLHTNVFEPSETDFCAAERYGSNVMLLRVNIQFSRHHLLKMLSSLQCVFLASWSNTRCQKVILFSQL